MLGLLSVRAVISAMKCPADSKSAFESAAMAEASKIRVSNMAICVDACLCIGARLLSSACQIRCFILFPSHHDCICVFDINEQP